MEGGGPEGRGVAAVATNGVCKKIICLFHFVSFSPFILFFVNVFESEARTSVTKTAMK
jgi:hypothetical protein